MDNESAVTLSGTVEGVVYSNEDNGYTVADLDCNGELVTIVGVLGDVREGESLTLIGEYVNSPKYGRQFKAEVCERALPNTESAVRKFLGSGVITGVGPAMAKRIVTAFGANDTAIFTVNVIESAAAVRWRSSKTTRRSFLPSREYPLRAPSRLARSSAG